MRQCEVYLHGIKAGMLTEEDNGEYTFIYDSSYLEKGDCPSVSLTLPLREEPYRSTVLFPFFFNMLSEGENRKLQSQLLHVDAEDDFGILLATAHYDTIGAVTIAMITLTVCPSTLAEGFDTHSPAARKKMFDDKMVSHYLRVPSPSTNSKEANEAIRNAKRISLSGVQPKYSVIVDEQESYLRYTQEGEQGTYILKPCPSSYHILNRDYCAANEHLTMQIAAQVYGIETAANGLCFFNNDEAAYLTRRFDVHDGKKSQQEDFAALMGYTKANGGSDYKYCNGSYEECAEVIQKYVKAARIDILRFFRLIVFNFISLNDDAHLKNFSLINSGDEYRLSPAYNLINTSLHLTEPRRFALDKGLFKEGMNLGYPSGRSEGFRGIWAAHRVGR